jgi:ABC-2 type transport system ATP-binding protein
MSELKRRHRIRAELKGFLPPPPAELQSGLAIRNTDDGITVIDTPGELSPLLSWLADAPLEEMTIEPVGLRPLYDRLHGTGAAEADPVPPDGTTES